MSFQEGRGGGEFRGRGRGRGGDGDFGDRGRGRGGYGDYGDRGRGRGGYADPGGRDQNNPMRQEDEGIAVLSKNIDLICSSPMSVVTNVFKVHLQKCKCHVYVTHYIPKENATDVKGDTWKIDFQKKILRDIVKQSDTPTDFSLVDKCICTGQHILSAVPLDIGDGFCTELSWQDRTSRKGVVTRTYTVKLVYETQQELSLPQHASWINEIIALGMRDLYPHMINSYYVDLNSRRLNGDLATLDAVSVKVFLAKEGKNMTSALLVDVSRKALSTQLCMGFIDKLKMRNPSDYKRLTREGLVGMAVVPKCGSRSVLKVKEIHFDKTASMLTNIKGMDNETYVQYFNRKYGFKVNPQAPLLLCRQANRGKGSFPLLFPADTLELTTLMPNHLKLLPKLCSIYPAQRMEQVAAVLKNLLANEWMKSVLSAYGIKVSQTPIEANGKVLRPPTVYIPMKNGYSKTSIAEVLSRYGFTRNLENVCHPDAPKAFDNFLVDKGLVQSGVLELLKKFNVALPPPKHHEFKKYGVQGNMGRCFCFQSVKEDAGASYNDRKAAFAKNAAVSQFSLKDINRNIAVALANQISAKICQMNYVVDVNEICPNLKNRTVLIIGTAVNSAVDVSRKQSVSLKTRQHTVVFTAFVVTGGKSWAPYCSHFQVKGQEVVIDTVSDAGSTHSPTVQSSDNRVRNPSEVLVEELPHFVEDVVGHFRLADKGVVLLYRGAADDGEMIFTENLSTTLQHVLPKWNHVVVSVQPKCPTRMAWDPNTVSNPGKDGSRAALCNAPRGFVSQDCSIVLPFDSEGQPEKECFYLTSASCTLGHASNSFYVVHERCKAVSLEALQALTYSMCYLYPNKADALPLPLPIKCAYEYARKFSVLKNVPQLPQSMRASMHYL